METFLGFDICAVVIMILLIMAQIVRKMTKGRTNNLFMALSITVLLSAALDLWDGAYSYLLTPTAYNLYLRYAISFFYYILRNLAMPVYVMYLCSYIGRWYVVNQSNHFKFIVFVPYLFNVLLLTTNVFTLKMFYFDANMVYRRGDWNIILYVVALYYIVTAFVFIILNRKLLSVSKFLILSAFLPINGMAVLFQISDGIYRIDAFTLALAILVISLGVQRPEETIDNVVGTDNYNSFINRIGNIYKTKEPHSLLLIRIVNSAELRSSVGLDSYTKLIRIVGDKIYRLDKVMKCRSQIYYMDHGDFAVVSDRDNYEEVLDMGRMLAAYMQETFKIGQLEVMLDARICLIDIPKDIAEYDALLNFCSTFHTKLPQDKRVMSLDTVADSKDFRMRNDMDAIIKRGIQNYNFQMYYQPIYSVKEGKFVSAEALIRLKDDQYGFVSPALFIPQAEESGAIHQIGDFVLEDVMRFIGGNDFKSLGLEYIEINLSVAQCIESNLFEKIDGLMQKYGVRPEQINLEITETGTNYDPATTDRNISLLKEKGITFSLDDYGTGYSSIARVVTLPLDIVKLDKSLVDDMDSAMMWTVITNTVNMLKRMNKKILVEGVENKRALDKFVELGCDYIQGFYFSKPLNETDFLKYVISKNFGVDI